MKLKCIGLTDEEMRCGRFSSSSSTGKRRKFFWGKCGWQVSEMKCYIGFPLAMWVKERAQTSSSFPTLLLYLCILFLGLFSYRVERWEKERRRARKKETPTWAFSCSLYRRAHVPKILYVGSLLCFLHSLSSRSWFLVGIAMMMLMMMMTTTMVTAVKVAMAVAWHCYYSYSLHLLRLQNIML